MGPIYSGSPDDERLLASAYQSCLNLAEQHQVKSIAFPSLSTGVYGYSLGLAAPIALRTIIEHIKKPTSLQQVVVVLFGETSYRAHEKVLAEIIRGCSPFTDLFLHGSESGTGALDTSIS